jgi:signal transduction histidine kinase/CheY-like chemotaxis protein/purine-cytosine permease-like protein
VRRQYNRWVANQTFEDYALRYAASKARTWSIFRVANTALGSVTFLALEAIGGLITLQFGFINAVAAILVVSGLIFATGIAVASYAARYAVDIDLLTRGAGFGYIGATVSSLLYAIFTFVFFAIEAAIMALALQMCLDVPLPVGYTLSALIIIPLVTYGITFIGRFQLWTQPVWTVLQVLPFVAIIAWAPQAITQWTEFAGVGGQTGSFQWALFGAAASVVFALMGQIGEQVDFLRFLPERTDQNRWRWWCALIAAGPGWIVVGGLKMLAGSLLAVVALNHGVPLDRAAEPTEMYRTGFGFLIADQRLCLAVTLVFIVLSQLKINVTNAYAGSIAWSNFFSRLTHTHPGRVVWLVFNVMIALLLMQRGVYHAFDRILAIYSNLAVAWIGAVVADLIINKLTGLSPPGIEFRRAYLRGTNPVGVGAMMLATAAALTAFSGVLGPTVAGSAGFIGLGTALIASPLIAFLTRGRYYFARQPQPVAPSDSAETIACCICQYSFERPDMADCPAYDGPICSLCCTLDARCGDRCKPATRLLMQSDGTPGLRALRPILSALQSRSGRFVKTFGVLVLTIAVVLSFIYLQASIDYAAHTGPILTVLWSIFCFLAIVAGIVSWLIVLAEDSRGAAREESERQTALLMAEIDAHKQTDAELQRSNVELHKAKEGAESANRAKTRYLLGISHELRSPLNAISGYAQLLDHEGSVPPNRRNAIRVIRRSAEHMTSLVEGLLDISKSQSNRLYLQRNEVQIGELLEQISDMFRLQAAAKGLEFRFSTAGPLPDAVYGDEKRLRQILINLLSNAIKFTVEGHVALRIRYRDPIAEIEVEDTGLGVAPGDTERIFEPFERGRHEDRDAAPGTGLGLTITKSLVTVMGGELSLSSEPGRGSRFKLRLALSRVHAPSIVRTAAHTEVRGRPGERLRVLVADDDASHRDLVTDLLSPLGYEIEAVPDGVTCLERASASRPDLVLLDISMPKLNGWEVARRLRALYEQHVPIVMISGDAPGLDAGGRSGELFDGSLTKPLDVDALLALVGALTRPHPTPQLPSRARPPQPADRMGKRVPSRDLQDLYRMGEIGYVPGIRSKLNELRRETPDCNSWANGLESLIDRLDLPRFMATLEQLMEQAEP